LYQLCEDEEQTLIIIKTSTDEVNTSFSSFVDLFKLSVWKI